MGFYQFKREIKLPLSKEDLWEFMRSPYNLDELTPPKMGFKVTSEVPEKMYSGMIISYIVKPMFGIPVKWLSEITNVKEGSYFIDQQRSGPYKMWHHQHILEEIDNGVLMTDIVTYIPPFGILGDIANSLFIKKKLNQIFDHRTLVLVNKFGKYE